MTETEHYSLPLIFDIPNEVYIPDRRTFGGEIYEKDFSTEYGNGLIGNNIPNRIVGGWVFDRECRKDSEGLQRRIAHKKAMESQEAENV